MKKKNLYKNAYNKGFLGILKWMRITNPKNRNPFVFTIFKVRVPFLGFGFSKNEPYKGLGFGFRVRF